MSDVHIAVQRYLAEGWSVLPIPRGSKAPTEKDWVHRTFTLEDFPQESNVGVRLGTPSGHLVDIDLDVPEAVLAAPTLLPKTERIHGRPGTGASHYWYICEGAKSEKWQDVDGKVLVEIRSTGGQTVLPPSIHPSGESISWDIDRAPSGVVIITLRHRARSVATAALLARHWPTGSRHVAARDAAGFLAARELDPHEIEGIIRAAAAAAHDEEVEDRARVARETVQTFLAGGKTTGAPTLEASVGQDVVALLLKWYGGNQAIHDGLVEEMNKTRFGTTVGTAYVYGLERDDRVVFQQAKALFEEFVNQRVKIGDKQKRAKQPDGSVVSSIDPVYRSKFEIWREHPKKRTFRTVVFSPPPLKADERDYNLWTGFAVRPLVPPKDDPARASKETLRAWADREAAPRCQLYLNLIRDVICSGNEEHYTYLIKWLALCTQQPGLPAEIAAVLRGELGAGKGTFARTFGSLFGRHFTHLDRAETLAGKFNAAISGKIVIFADEAFFAGNKQDLGSLKRLITEPTISIERKGFDPIEEPNCIHLIMATNNDHAHQAAMKERRFFDVHVSDIHLQDHAYFNAITTQINTGGREALLAYLLTREVTPDDVRRVPMTQELRGQQEKSLPFELQWWHDRLHQGTIGDDETWPADASTRALHQDYLRWCDEMRVNRRVSEVVMGRETLKGFLGERRRPTGDDGTRRATRTLLPLNEARTLFDARTGTHGDWPEDLAPKGAPRGDLPF